MGLTLPNALAACLLIVSPQVGSAGQTDSAGERSKPVAHTTQTIEGWTVHVDDRLLAPQACDLGNRATRLLANSLYEITLVLGDEPLKHLKQVQIWLDLSHGKLVSMQYHPSAGWLRDHGYSTNLAKCVHIPSAAYYADPRDHRRQPWAILHELAHAYHDQVLGFDHPEIKAAYEKFKTCGRYESVLQIEGSTQKHYALTDPQEFFAEMTEAYCGMNDFFPFNRAELKCEEPEVFALLRRIWGPLR